jgi:hypothetical protein
VADSVISPSHLIIPLIKAVLPVLVAVVVVVQPEAPPNNVYAAVPVMMAVVVAVHAPPMAAQESHCGQEQTACHCIWGKQVGICLIRLIKVYAIQYQHPMMVMI